MAVADALDAYPPIESLGSRIYKICLELFARAAVILPQISSDKHQVTLEAPVEYFKWSSGNGASQKQALKL